jgi:hypothetical protein
MGHSSQIGMKGSPYGQPPDGGGARYVRSNGQSRPQTLPLSLAGHGKLASDGAGSALHASPLGDGDALNKVRKRPAETV